MKTSSKAGFTIVEIMLFLAVSGALVAGVLIGTGTAINIQRYRDSVMSLQSSLQQQYSNVANVSNDRDSSWSCDLHGPSQGDPGTGIAIGQSDCVLLGKYITNNGDGVLMYKNVVGYIDDNLSLSSTDVESLKDLQISISQIATETYEIEWGSTLVNEESDQELNFSILILRSPASGVLRTFIDPKNSVADNNVGVLIDQNLLSESVKMCVDSGGIFGGADMAVQVKANASSASAVETLGDDSGC